MSWLTGQPQPIRNDYTGLFFVFSVFLSFFLFLVTIMNQYPNSQEKKFHDWLAKYAVTSRQLCFGTHAIYMSQFFCILWEPLEGRALIPYNHLSWLSNRLSELSQWLLAPHSYSSRLCPSHSLPHSTLLS